MRSALGEDNGFLGFARNDCDGGILAVRAVHERRPVHEPPLSQFAPSTYHAAPRRHSEFVEESVCFNTDAASSDPASDN